MDGNTPEKFREMCAEKGPTVAVGKVLYTEEILGGYNPIACVLRLLLAIGY